ncbi:MAG: 4-hydroxythreonine-4-phosphate dehydrogenase PdxA [Zymomonas mobilis subsp. pomaceae]|uniref:4-hydroxythreonine-4-phosphate dehydrogenase n=1 Tax=Zymomonas mobilis subsp. pomaceae (strain ATCC 29192 / DSM 22645 / JCM 10191 / CCUG 17912 / NBRC 13757 / NCIMB 11200 / NRRL B-4491 / Barker I) TaxID=579138 RepID=F8ET41_ZYMMT|nr:4-hydroxythreonine-4-phosphate dehydrogenase PdxA [Zymomonas mobilis]AEI36931.1 4-hydroxythreonine-4-phosphate dehydrogenase [Zymomonas mobilis subsp. pomaceae ATCC 29192]MDX5948304.1 4-hydroxythreonine-4-phosphate dehydrogenase PdxA [Zymomonas mobilis subsp. pomaceae]GEB89058.1 4-hydroxythreonine-4-phosphate dehydrogenase 1 [Zymomonas mobilis subsp. pomaceae]
MKPLVVTLGDPAGIGPEIVAKAWRRRENEKLMPFFAVGSVASLKAASDIPVKVIHHPDEALRYFDQALPLFEIPSLAEVRLGQPDQAGAQVTFSALEVGVKMALHESASALVTAPVSKEHLYKVGFTFPGQTEFVADRCGIAPDQTVMMLAGPDLRTVPLTIHIPYKDVPSALTLDLIISRARVTAEGLRYNFGIQSPRLVIAGLNPHAGENGAIGREEIEIIRPAVKQLQSEGIDIQGPFAADTLFNPRARAGYDAALCPTHDQALIPIKTINFDNGVNTTLGLPIIRTSPDHGTAFALAGKDKADEGAMVAALLMAAESVHHRQAYKKIHAL